MLTFGSTQGSIPLAALGAGIALVLVAVVGVLVRAPLARVPENTMKFAVGVMLTTFGIFWSAEGAGAHWPGDDASLPGRARVRGRCCRSRRSRLLKRQAARVRMRRIRAFGRFWWDFVVGDDWRAAAGVVLAIGVTAALVAGGVDAWWLMPAAVAAILWLSLRRAARGSAGDAAGADVRRGVPAAERAEIFTTSPVCGAWMNWPPPM